MISISRIAAFGAVALALSVSTMAEAKLKRITIGSNKQGSVFFLLASGFAKTLQQNLKIRATAQPHSGSSVYLSLMDNGEMTLGLNNSMDSGAAVRGKAPFRSTMKNIRAIARVWIIPYAFMVRADSKIYTIADLRGKKVVTKTTSIVSLTNLNLAMLAGGGLSPKDITPLSSGGIVSNVNMVIEGRADAGAAAIGMPVVRKGHATIGIRFLPLASATTDAYLASNVPGARTYVRKPHKRYPFIKKTMTLAAFDAYLNAGKQVDADDAYAIAKTLHTQWKTMQKAYGPLRGVKPSQIAPATNSHPYHEGAVKYYKEAGIWSAANEKTRAALRKALGM